MHRRTGVARRYGIAAASLMVTAAFVRVLTAPLTPTQLILEGAIAALVLVFVGVSVRLTRYEWSRRWPLLLLYAVVPSMLAGAGLWIAAPAIPDFTMIAALIFASIMLSIDVGAARGAIFVAGAAVIAAFVGLWVAVVPLTQVEIGSLLIAVGFLLGLQLLVLAHGERVRRQVDARALEGIVFAAMARKIGTARDVPSVAAAVLEACKETFPQTSYGWIFLMDDSDGLLKSHGVLLTPDGVTTGGPSFDLAPGEGMAGSLYTTGHASVWPTTIEVSMAQASLREANRLRLRELRVGFMRSAIGAPLRPPDTGVVGVILLTATRQESAWSTDDLDVMEALADEAALAIERARRHEADVDQALMDSVTGLVSHRQLLNVIDKEVARAARAESTVAVIFSDLDRFKEINDAWGHDAGNRVLVMYANVLRAMLRREDTAARYGGDEFVVVLPGADREQAVAVANRMRQRFATVAADDPVVGGAQASVSCGIAIFPADAETAPELLTAADAELLRAKRRSQNVVGRARFRARQGGPVQQLTSSDE
jgi:diguanylate cyclase (GGDEF)-like protein